jgi:rubrerythrin
MTDRIARTSQALASVQKPLLPAFEGCPECGTVLQIAAPRLGHCPVCGSMHRVLARADVVARFASIATM